MSYILDALRKAERERAAGASAPLEIVTQGGAPQIVQRRPWWPWALAGGSAAVALAAVVTLVVMRKPAAPAAPAVAPPVTAEEEVPPDQDVAMLPADEVLPDGFEPPIDDSMELGGLDELARPGARPVLRQGEPPEPFDAEAAGLTEPMPEEPFEEAPPEEEYVEEAPLENIEEETGAPDTQSFDYAEPPAIEEPVAEEPPAEELAPPPAPSRPAPPASPPTEVQTLKLDPAPGTPAKLLKEMPSQYRADFPKLKVEVHVWDAKVQKRWVIINSRRYREGDTIVEGPRIDEVVRDGIVFEFRGERVLFPR